MDLPVEQTELPSPTSALARRFELPSAAEDAGETGETAAVEVVRRYGLHLGDYGLLLPVETLAEVADDVRLCKVPNTPEWFAGVMNQRGNMVPVFKLAAMLGGDMVGSAESWVVVVGARDQAVGLQVHDLPTTVMLSEEQRLSHNPTTHVLLDRFVSATYSAADSVWFDWDIDGFFMVAGDLSGHPNILT